MPRITLTPGIKITALTAASLLALAGCGGDEQPGRLSLHLTDAPVEDAEQVVIEFTGIELRREDGERVTFEFEPRQIDLLKLTGGNSVPLLEDEELPAGRYSQIRLTVNAGRHGSDSYLVTKAGGQYPLFIPSGNQTGLKLSGITVPAGGRADFTIDFDLRKSVTKPRSGDHYILRPTLRLVDNTRVGAIAGSVAAELAGADGCQGVVYVYEGMDATLGDLGSAHEPLSSAGVSLHAVDGNYRYHAAFLPSGDYTVAFTCDAGQDDPERENELVFTPGHNVTVTAGSVTTLDIDAE